MIVSSLVAQSGLIPNTQLQSVFLHSAKMASPTVLPLSGNGTPRKLSQARQRRRLSSRRARQGHSQTETLSLVSTSTSLTQRELLHGDTSGDPLSDSSLQSGEELQNAPPPPSDNELQSAPPPPSDHELQSAPPPPSDNELQSAPPPPSDNELQSAPPPPSDNELQRVPLPPSEQLCITIHRTDVLCASVNLVHPMVRVSVVEGEGGQLLKKSHPGQCVASFYERDNPAVDYILPVMTQPCSLQEHCLQPEWEESLVLNEQLEHFSSRENLLIFFELLDFSSSQLSPWHKIAWAFLSLQGHIGQRCRLQLYQFPKKSHYPPDVIEVYVLWSHRQLKPYPSTLHVTLQASAPDCVHPHPHTRSMVPTQPEVGSVSFDQLGQQTVRSTVSLAAPPPPSLSLRSRLPGQSCRVPLSLLTPLHVSSGGCSALAFSPDGRFLAAACVDGDRYPLIITEVTSCEQAFISEGHCGLIHSVCWAPDSTLLATASADGLAKVWRSEHRDSQPVCVLPHPCFVYAVSFTNSAGQLFTGAYDGSIRLWQVNSADPHLLQELKWHSGLVNSLVFCGRSHMLYSAESQGQVAVWGEEKGCWQLRSRIKAVEGHPITSLSLHCNSRKLLVQSSDGLLAMLDLRIGSVYCEYHGDLGGVCSASVLSPCGGLVMAGGEGGRVGVWRSDDGQLVHMYRELPLQCPVSAIVYHPHEHTAAFTAFGSHQPLVLATVDPSLTQTKHTLEPIS